MSTSQQGTRVPTRRPSLGFWIWCAVCATAIAAVSIYLGVARTDQATRLVVGNLAFTVALTFGAVSCGQAAARQPWARAGWGWVTFALGMAAFGQLVFTVSPLRGQGAEASVLTDGLGYLGYTVPLMVALFSFPKPQERLISRVRGVVDAAVITVGILLLSEATVLGVARQSADLHSLSGVAGLAYPMVDVAICAVVLTLGMRQPPHMRMTWLLLGSGLVSLGLTDSLYVRLNALGAENLTGTPLVAGWLAAPALVGLATKVPQAPAAYHWNFELVSRLVPYVPVVGAAVVIAERSVRDDPFLLATAAVLLVVLTIRQVMIVYENLALTRDLEAKVAERTKKLVTLGSIVTSSQDAIVGFDTERVIIAWNPAAEQLYGHAARDVLGLPAAVISPAAERRVADNLLAARAGDPLQAYETNFRRPDGSVVPVSMTVSPVLDGEVVTGVSFSGQDITERRRTAQALETARQDALQSARAKSEFLATMSHEIRTPMNGVIGLTSLLLDTDLDPQQRGYAEGVHGAGQSLLDVINDILDFSKLEAGKVILDPDDFDLRRLVEEIGNLLAPAAFAQGLELLVDYPPDVPVAVRGDHVRIRQILLNLASNAVKFTSTGEVQIKVRSIAAPKESTRLRFEVIDSGIGMEQSQQAQLFESFSQADASTTRRYGGTGLGLAICRRLVEVMEGSIGLLSVIGAGSTFWFELDLPVAEMAPARPLERRPELPPGLRVLVVDDNATNRTILEQRLGAWGMRVDSTDHACDALQRLRDSRAAGEPFDLAVLDMLMPEVDGLQLARMITADPLLRGLPMIMLSSAQQLPAAQMREAGIGRWLTKPASTDRLHEQLVRVLMRNAPAPSPLANRAVAPPRRRGCVLVVEDNPLNQMVAAGLVARLGFENEVAGNGAEALIALEQRDFAAVLMDCHMPVMDGYAATEEIRRRERGRRRTPVIALTAGALVSDRERCLAAGMDAYVAKPIDADALATILDSWVPDAAASSGATAPDPGAAALEHGQSDAPVDQERLESLSSLRSADGTSMLGSFVASFVGRADERLLALRDAARSGDAEALVAAAHELKGSAATIGAVRVATLCDDLERGGSTSLLAQPRLLDVLEHELTRATRALIEHVGALA